VKAEGIGGEREGGFTDNFLYELKLLVVEVFMHNPYKKPYL